MPASSAASLVVLDGRYPRYEEVSRDLRAILCDITPIVEPIGLDEAFLDVTGGLHLLGAPEDIGSEIRRRVRTELSLDCSVGIGRSKLIAKLASRAAKPRAQRQGTHVGSGVVAIEAHEELNFLHPLPVRALWGVGPATAERLHSLGVETVGELARVPRGVLERRFGPAQGSHLADLSMGHDTSPVVPDREAKSIGNEETFARDIDDLADLRRRAAVMADVVAAQLRKHELAARTVSVKIRFGDFSSVTRSHTVAVALDTGPALGAVCDALLESLDVSPGVRLLGVSASGLTAAGGARQLSFDLDATTEQPSMPTRASGSEPGHPSKVGCEPVRARATATARHPTHKRRSRPGPPGSRRSGTRSLRRSMTSVGDLARRRSAPPQRWDPTVSRFENDDTRRGARPTRRHWVSVGSA